jgi:hypothetical protein
VIHPGRGGGREEDLSPGASKAGDEFGGGVVRYCLSLEVGGAAIIERPDISQDQQNFGVLSSQASAAWQIALRFSSRR